MLLLSFVANARVSLVAMSGPHEGCVNFSRPFPRANSTRFLGIARAMSVEISFFLFTNGSESFLKNSLAVSSLLQLKHHSAWHYF